MSTGEFLIGWLILVVIVVLAIYFGPRLRSRSRTVSRTVPAKATPVAATTAAMVPPVEDAAVPRPSEPHDAEAREAVLTAHTTDPSTVKQPGPLPRWFSRKLKHDEPAPQPAAGESFTIDPVAVKGDSEMFGRQGEVRDVPLEIEEIATSRGAQLRTLDGLRAQGFITDEEYEQRRNAILGN